MIPAYDDFNVYSHMTCFDSFDVTNDIIELRIGGANDVRIRVNLINNGVTTKLRFGHEEETTYININANLVFCASYSEDTPAIRIQNGKIIQSACKGLFV